MPVIPFQSASRIAQDAQAAADLQEQQAAEAERRYREGADAKLKELRATGVKKFDATAGTPMINVPDPVPAGGARLNAPGIETPDMREPSGYFSDNYQPKPGDALWDQFEADRTGPNRDIENVVIAGGNSPNGTGGPENAVYGLTEEQVASLKGFMQKRDDESAALRTRGALLGQTKTPDQIAEAIDLAGRTGANRVEVEDDVATFRKLDTASQLDKLRQTAPKLRTWLDDPVNLEIAHDDAENIGWWESATSMAYNTPGALWAAAVGFTEKTFGVTQMGVDGTDELGRSPSPALAAIFGNPREADRIARDLNARGTGGTLPQDPNSPLAIASNAINAPRKSLREYKNAVMPQGRNDIESGYYSGIVSLAEQAPLIIASAVTKNPAFMTVGMTATTAGEAYSRATDEHPEMSYGQRAGYALTQAGIEFLTEVGPNALFVEVLLKGSIKEQIVGFGKQQIVEQFGEQTATAFQDMNDWLTLNPKATWEDYLKERPSAALQTFVATLVAGGGQVALGKASDAVGQRLDSANQQKRAEDLANFVRAMGDNAKDSKLLKRLPDKYREAVAAATKDGPRENVRISPEGVAELAQGGEVSVEQLAQAFRIDPVEMQRAMDSGDDIVVPSGNFAAVIQTAKKDIGVSGETIYQALAPHIRLSDKDFTAREWEAQQQVLKAEADARATWNTAENDFSASSEQVETDIRDQIRATGRFNESAVDGQARLMGQLVNVIAKQTGQDPAEVWKTDGFNIMSAVTGEQQDDGAVLPQTAELPADATPTQRLIDMRAKGSSNAEIATALYPDVEAKTAVNRVKALASKHKGRIDERKAQLEGTTQPAVTEAGAAPSGELASGGNKANATISLNRTRALIKLFEGGNLSSLAHEGAHWYLDLLFRMSKSENPHPFVQAQMARILEFAGKSQEWDGMFDAAGNFTEEGRKLQEQFAEAFEVHLMTGKAPSVGMRSVLSAFKQWLLGVYKAYRKGIDQAVYDVGPYTRARIDAYEASTGKKLTGQALFDFVVPQELRDTFDRMLATEDAITAAQSTMIRDSEGLAKAMLEKMDPEGKWKPERQQKFLDRMRERYAEAKERAEAALLARLMQESVDAQDTVRREEERDVRREVASEIDEQPAQRAFQVMSGQGWRDTRADQAEAQAEEADAMSTLAQMVSTEQRRAWQAEKGAVDDTPYFFGTYSAGALGDIENYDLSKAGSQSGSGERAMFLTTSSKRANSYADPGMGSANEYFTKAEDPARWEKVRAFLGGAFVTDEVVRGYISRSVDTPGVFKAYIRGPVREVDWQEYTGSVTFDDVAMKRLIDEEMARPEGPRNLRITNIADGGLDLNAVNMVVLDTDNVMNALSSSRADDAGSSLAQGGKPSRQLEDDPAAFGLTPQQAKKVNPIYRPKTLPVERLASNQDAALWLEGNFIGDPITDLTAELSDEQINEIAIVMAAEAQLALRDTGNAFTWYSSALAKALDIISIKYPMLDDDAVAAEAGFGTSANARFAFTFIMAVTSQNLDVAANSVATDKAFAYMLKRVRNGDFTMPRSWGTGDKQKAMGENFAKFGPLIDKMPGDDFPSKLEALDDLFRIKMTVKEWVSFMKARGIPYNAPGQTAMDAVVYGSSLLGPKIGNGFWQNLNGNYSPLTIDLWMRRTWGRLTGYSIGNPGALPDQRARLKASIGRSRSRAQGDADAIASEEKRRDDLKSQLAALKPEAFANKKAFTAEQTRLKKEVSVAGEIIADLQNIKAPEAWKAEYGKDDKALLEYSKRILRAWDQEYKRLREELGESVPADLQPTWARAAKTIVTNLAKPLDQVANGTQRKQIERAGQEALQILEARGVKLTTADLQAILWYPEKELWGALTAEMATDEDGVPIVPPNSLNESYDTAFGRILREQGYEVQGTAGDGSGGPGAGTFAGQDAGPQRSESAARSGRSGNAIAERRSDTAKSAGPQSLAQGGTLAQSQTHDPAGERELDALGFYSAVFEAAKSVRPDVWSMGWDHARNSIVKGGAKINGQRVAPRETEIAYLGLDAMFYGTKLKGAELAEAVLAHIQAKRLLLVENFARFDPNAKAPSKSVMLDEMDDDTLANMLGVDFLSMGVDEGRVVASELDGADEFHTGLFVRVVKQEPSDDPVKRYDIPRRSYNLYRGLNLPGKRELIATGVQGDLVGKAARIIVNEKRNLVMRKITAERMADVRRDALIEGGGNMVRGAGDIRLPGEDVPLFEAVIGLPEGVPGSDYQAPRSHVGGKAKGTLVTAHGEERIDDKGQRTLFTGQVQSDMAQKVRGAKEIVEVYEKVSMALSKGLEDYPDASSLYVSVNGLIVKPERGSNDLLRQHSREVIQQMIRAQRDAIREAEARLEDVTDAPLLSTSEWTNVGVRAMVYRAARDGFASVSFPTSETSEIIQGNDTAAGHYDTNVKGALEKIAKQLGGEMRRGAVKYGEGEPQAAPLEHGHIRLLPLDERRKELASKIQAEYDDPDGPDFGLIASLERDLERLNTEIGDAEAFYGIGDEDRSNSGFASAYILDITPEMRRKIVSEGFPLFQTRTGKDRIAQPANIPLMRLDLKAVEEQYGPEALAELPPQVRAHSTAATDADQFIQTAQDVKRSLNKKRPKSLWKFLSTPRRIGEGNDKISYRGIRDDGGEILKIIGAKKEGPGLIADQEDGKRARSYTVEHAAEVAWAEGYFSGESPPTPQEFLDALRADFDGQALLYARTDMALVDEINNAQVWADWFDQSGIDINEKDQAVLRAQIETQLSGQAENAIGPDEAAPFFGMPDGKALLEGLKQGPMRDKLIREETKRRMTALHGDTFTDGTIMDKAAAYARNEIQHRQFEIELEALADAAGKPAAANLAKQTAIDNLRSKQVREVLNYNQWLTLSERWAKKAIEAAGKGDMAKAATYAQYRLINSEMYVEAKKAAERVEKDVAYLKSFEKKDKRTKLAKAGLDYLDQMDQLLEGIELRKRPEKLLRERATLAEWFAAKQAEIDPTRDLTGLSEQDLMAAQQEEIDRSEALAAIQADASLRNYKSLTVEELSAVRDQADMIAKTASKHGALMVEGDRRLLNLAIDDIEAQAIIAQPKELPPESYASYDPKEKGKRENKEFFAELRTMQAIVRIIDGVDGGPLARNTTHKLNSAGADGVARLRLEEDRVVALFRAAYGTNLEVLRKDKITFPGIPVPLAKMERLTIALYWGTEISRRRIMDGYGWDQATVQNVLNSLDQADWQFVTSVWDYVNSLYPEATKAHEDVHGLPLSKQPGLPIVTRYGVIQGNYFPIKYNPHQSSRAEQQALTETAKQISGQAGTRKATGSTKERVKGKVTMPVLLDFSITLGMHVNEVVGNITTQKAVLDAGRILAHPRTQRIIVSRHGWVTYKALMSAMKDTRNGLAGPRGPSERIMVRVRNGATNVALGLNLGTVIKQMLGYTNSIVRLGDKKTGPIAGAGWLIRGMVRMGFGAQGMQNGVNFILQRSPYMRVRMQVMNQAIADQQRQINNGKIKADAKRVIDVVSMFMTQRVQFLGVDSPTWLGAYEKFTASGMSEQDAIASADQVVIDSQGSGDIWQVSAFQRGGPMQRIFTNYITAAIATWNMGVNVTKGTNFRNPGQAAIWAMNMGVLMVVPVIGGMVVNALMNPGGGDDDEPIEEQYIRAQIAFLLSPLGLFGQLTSAVGDYAYKGPQGTRAFDEASKVITEAFTAAENLWKGKATSKDAVDVLRPANMAAGVWFGYPAAALDRFVRGTEALISGKTDDPKALLVGPPRK
jgi:hypothetical protein